MQVVPAMRSVRTLVLGIALVAIAVLAPAVRAQQWGESGDAGAIVATAQATIGAGPLTSIVGYLETAYDADLFCIHLSAVPPTGLPIVQLQCVVNMGPNVYLFDAAGNGVFTNETCQAGGKTIVAPNVSLPAGTYYVAVSYYGWEPASAGGPIWLSGLPGQRAPDGPGAAGTLIGWGGAPVVQPSNPYWINLSFMEFCSLPTPAARPTWGSLKTIYR